MVDKDTLKEVVKVISQNALERHLMGRKFDKDKVKKWGDLIIEEINENLPPDFSEYEYIIFFYMSEITSYVSTHRLIYYTNTDVAIYVYYHPGDFYAEIRIFATKKRKPMASFLDFAKDKEFFLSVNKKISDMLEGRTYDFNSFSNLLGNIADDINNIIEKKNNKPCSFTVGYINKRPTRGLYFYYKFFNLELYPLFFNYKNKTFECRIYIFLINN